MPTVIFFAKGIWSHKQLGSVRLLKKACEQAGFKFVQPSYILNLEASVLIATLFLAIVSATLSSLRLLCLFIFFATMVVWYVFLKTLNPINTAAKFVKSVVEQSGDHQIMLGGEADGAHVASLLCTNQFYLRDAGVDPENVKGCFCLDGIFSDKLLDTSALKKHFGSRVCYFDVFPIYNLRQKTPPTLTVARKGDVQSYNYHYALLQSGVWGEILYNDKRTQATFNRIATFLKSLI
jgi:hypothetical protein